MKKFLGVSALALVLLAGCGSSAASYAGQSVESTEEGHEGEYATVTYDKDGDDITNTQFDIVLPDSSVEENGYSSTSKKEVSEAGEYGMGDATGKTWAEHVTELETYVDENDAMPTLDDEGKDVDGASGATIGLSQFDEAFNAATEA